VANHDSDMPLLRRKTLRSRESPRASEVDNWLDLEIASLRREIDQERESQTDASEHGFASSVRRRVERLRARRPSTGRGAADTPWRITRGAVRLTRTRGVSIVFYALAVATGILIGWLVGSLADFLANP
jgi:hypothetical protein